MAGTGSATLTTRLRVTRRIIFVETPSTNVQSATTAPTEVTAPPTTRTRHVAPVEVKMTYPIS